MQVILQSRIFSDDVRCIQRKSFRSKPLFGRTQSDVNILNVTQSNRGIPGQPKAAFNCLSQAATVYSRNPRLWLRIAECAIGVVQKSQENEQIQNCKSNTVKAIVGSGIYRKTILNTSFQNLPKKCRFAKFKSTLS